jgi:hypothetical protein
MITSARASVGAQMVRAAQKLADVHQREQWPYVHVYPPPASIPVHEISYIAAPAAGASGVVLGYQVPEGFAFFLRSILQVFTGGAFSPGDATWTVNVNSTAGLSDVQAMPVQGLIAVRVQLGSLAAGNQWPLPRAYEFGSLDLVQSVVANVNAAGGFFVSGFFGYLVPTI